MSDQRTQKSGQKLQELGRDLVSQMYVYIRSLQLYSLDNEVFLGPLQRMETLVNWLVTREGKVHLFGASYTLYLNDQLLQFRPAFLEQVSFLSAAFAEREMGGVFIDRTVTQGDLQAFLMHFLPNRTQTPQGSFFKCEALGSVRKRMQVMEERELELMQALHIDPQRYAFLLYHRLFRFVAQLYAPKAPDPHTQVAVRTLQELIDLTMTNQLQFLGLTDESDPISYEVYHVCNATVLAVIFAGHLGLGKMECLELGLATLFHNIGKILLPTKLLHKQMPLSNQDYAEVRRLPLYSVQRILRGAFSWERLHCAIIAADLKRPPHAQDEAELPWLYSRIIRICGCFDALCTERPFRPKMYPMQALLFMQRNMKGQFDQGLFHRFFHLFGKMAVHAAGGSLQNIEPPAEARQLPHTPMPALLEGAWSSEIEEYWALQSTQRTPAQEARLQEIERSLQGTIQAA